MYCIFISILSFLLKCMRISKNALLKNTRQIHFESKFLLRYIKLNFFYNDANVVKFPFFKRECYRYRNTNPFCKRFWSRRRLTQTPYSTTRSFYRSFEFYPRLWSRRRLTQTLYSAIRSFYRSFEFYLNIESF